MMKKEKEKNKEKEEGGKKEEKGMEEKGDKKEEEGMPIPPRISGTDQLFSKFVTKKPTAPTPMR
jgi:hypothetical protein